MSMKAEFQDENFSQQAISAGITQSIETCSEKFGIPLFSGSRESGSLQRKVIRIPVLLRGWAMNQEFRASLCGV